MADAYGAGTGLPSGGGVPSGGSARRGGRAPPTRLTKIEFTLGCAARRGGRRSLGVRRCGPVRACVRCAAHSNAWSQNPAAGTTTPPFHTRHQCDATPRMQLLLLAAHLTPNLGAAHEHDLGDIGRGDQRVPRLAVARHDLQRRRVVVGGRGDGTADTAGRPQGGGCMEGLQPVHPTRECRSTAHTDTPPLHTTCPRPHLHKVCGGARRRQRRVHDAPVVGGGPGGVLRHLQRAAAAAAAAAAAQQQYGAVRYGTVSGDECCLAPAPLPFYSPPKHPPAQHPRTLTSTPTSPPPPRHRTLMTQALPAKSAAVNGLKML